MTTATTEAERAYAEIFGLDVEQVTADRIAEERACWIPPRVLDALAGWHPEVFAAMRRAIMINGGDARTYKTYALTACSMAAVVTLDAEEYYRLGRVAHGGNWGD